MPMPDERHSITAKTEWLGQYHIILCDDKGTCVYVKLPGGVTSSALTAASKNHKTSQNVNVRHTDYYTRHDSESVSPPGDCWAKLTRHKP